MLYGDVSILQKQNYSFDRNAGLFSLYSLFKEDFSLWSSFQAELNIVMDKFQSCDLNSDATTLEETFTFVFHDTLVNSFSSCELITYRQQVEFPLTGENTVWNH